ncbi:MAG: hypothetical protein JW771_02790 [Candidatus Thermoplasmatota archaeon]|nr:hypothetical protein [Candidatus Thermoplasmatota archaeon]
MNRWRKNIKNADDAIVGVVSTFLIVGLVVAVVSVVQTVYIPNWMEQQEAEHMEDVGNQFAQLKYAIEEHLVTKQRDIPISTSITLGSKELPFLLSSRAFGSVTILSNQCTITVTNRSNTTLFSSSVGGIKYSSANAYFLNQDYIYEAGAVILHQDQGNTMAIKPRFLVTNEEEVSISFTITNISTVGGKSSIAGYGTYPVQTEFSAYNDTIPIMQNVSTITIGTEYQNAWHRFLNGTLRNQGLNYHGYGTDYTILLNESGVTVEFAESTAVVLDITRIQINAQVAPGWIENIK